MSRVVSWLQHHENRMFCWVNQRLQHTWLDRLFNTITHLGGATATIAIALCLSLFGKGSLQLAGFHCCAVLALSHIPVALIKRKYPRLRPYLVVPDTHTCKKPLSDPSFPSGHTAAIFSVAVPLACATPWLAPVVLPLACLVGMSRIYLGLHYPSDCLAGSILGTTAALATASFFV
ncbi:phosphatase PAP2 family protein [Paenibacillus rigui]|uniref:Phosphatase PAP2 family protein n=1 Tax=Paenibacillus rigui TaxID=554312 RepID=A0A229UY13_9BACL|nr:phosphatase PAP2 family protein [Paenibacillus rigui]OXM88328.1 phosphatase PAP2 family protein [Paenibacillus rigui]